MTRTLMTIPPGTVFLSVTAAEYAEEAKMLTDAGAFLLGFLDNKDHTHVYLVQGRPIALVPTPEEVKAA